MVTTGVIVTVCENAGDVWSRSAVRRSAVSLSLMMSPAEIRDYSSSEPLSNNALDAKNVSVLMSVKPNLYEENHPFVHRFVPGDGCFLRVFEGLFSGG